MATYQDQLSELVNIYIKSKEGGDEDFYRELSKELRTLSNSWQE